MDNKNNNKGSFLKGVFLGILFWVLFFLILIIGIVFKA
tara:strand:+ start:97 stop:210 length:114 start_codon:yes stop_codon:yes gene_type:complete